VILDFGCGSGRRWGEKDDQVIGIDVNLNRLRIARRKILVTCCDGRFLPFRDKVFRCVISDSVFEHIYGYQKALAEMKRVIDNGGRLTIIQPVDNDPLFVLARRVARTWDRDKVHSKFTSRYLLRLVSQSFTISSVTYLPNAPIAGILGFFNREMPRFLSTLDRVYKEFCKMTRLFHWEVIIECSVPPQIGDEVSHEDNSA
jgi:ubiquinone/menaquinone biosynthesis C-methylase UbiE